METVEIPENFVDTGGEPNDWELLKNFTSEIRVGPSQQLSGRVFWQGKDWSITAAIEAEKQDFLSQARSRWLAYRNAFRARKAAAERAEQERREFEQRASESHYTKVLLEELGRVQGMYRDGCLAATELRDCGVERDKLVTDTAMDVAQAQKLLANIDGRINVLSVRIAAQETAYREELKSLSEATESAIRELYHRWGQTRGALIKRVIQALRVIVSIGDDRDREVVDWVSIRAHSVVTPDNSVGCLRNSLKIGWANAKGDPLLLAQEVVDRASQFERYLQGQTCRGYEKALEPRIA